MYAKYYAVKKLEYVIGDRPFIWYTDQKITLLYVPQALIKCSDGIYISKILT